MKMMRYSSRSAGSSESSVDVSVVEASVSKTEVLLAVGTTGAGGGVLPFGTTPTPGFASGAIMELVRSISSMRARSSAVGKLFGPRSSNHPLFFAYQKPSAPAMMTPSTSTVGSTRERFFFMVVSVYQREAVLFHTRTLVYTLNRACFSSAEGMRFELMRE